MPDVPVISVTSEEESVSVTTGQQPNSLLYPKSRNAVNTSQNNPGSYDRTMLDAFTRTAEFEQELKEIEQSHMAEDDKRKRRWARPSEQYLKKNKTNVELVESYRSQQSLLESHRMEDNLVVPQSTPQSSTRELKPTESEDADEALFGQALANIRAVKRESMRLLHDASPSNSINKN